MEYCEYLPHPKLRREVECYWRIWGKPSSNFRPIYPDGCMDIIINLGSELIMRNSLREEKNRFRLFVVGNMTRTVYSKSTSEMQLLGIRFRPGALCQWLNIPLHELTDARVELREVLTDLPDENLLNERSEVQQISYLNGYLLRKRKTLPTRSNWRTALQQIVEHQGTLRVSQLYSQTGLSSRQLERHFKMYVGLSPKQLSQVLRFRHLKQQMEQGRTDSLLGMAADLGFTDHAHLTNFFKEFADVAPTWYEKQKR